MHRRVLCVVTSFCLVAALATGAAAQVRTTTRVSVSSAGSQGTNRSFTGALGGTISADGRYVVFVSLASNLVQNDTNGVADVFVRDRQAGTTTRVSVGSGGAQATAESDQPAISGDGRYVVFASNAELVADDTNGVADVFVHDRQTATTSRVSLGASATQATGGPSYQPAISDDGRYVAFTSDATNLVPGDTNGVTDVFVRDRTSGTTTRVSVATISGQAGGVEADNASVRPAISGDGRYVAFDSLATNLVVDDTNGRSDVFVRELLTATTTRVSVATDGTQAGNQSFTPTLSADGRYVAYVSDAWNLVAGDTNGVYDVFVRDRMNATTTRVSVVTGGAEANGDSTLAAISRDGRFVAFDSLSSNLALGDTNVSYDVFVHDLQATATTRVSVGEGGAQGNLDSYVSAISGDGRYVVFDSIASNLVTSDSNAQFDVFVRDQGVRQVIGDYDGDGSTDLCVFRPAGGFWFVLSSATGAGSAAAWGVSGDVPVPGDYDGDGKTDRAVYRPGTGTWYILQTGTGTAVSRQWGVSGDLPAAADYDGDHKTDMAVFRPSSGTWYIVLSSNGSAVAVPWGGPGDVPVPADFDGDGKADVTVFRPSTGAWYQSRSASGTGYGVFWGGPGDVPLAGDYDGDGKADVTVFRPSAGAWYQMRSASGSGFGAIWGMNGDVPIVGDYDGDGKADLSIFRPSSGHWYVIRSSTGVAFSRLWGVSADIPR